MQNTLTHAHDANKHEKEKLIEAFHSGIQHNIRREQN